VAVSVLLVDDVAELRAVLRQRLVLHGGFDVVAEAGEGVAAVEAAARCQPDLIVLDLGLPDLAGHEVLTRLRIAAPAAQVVVYTGSVSRDRFALARDVDGYVFKDQDVSYLVELLVDLSGRGRQAATLAVGPGTADVGLARRFLAAHCERWGCDRLLDDAELVVTELVTNALIHGGRRCDVAISFGHERLRIEVRDDHLGGPEVQAADAQREHGRGLILVSAMADAWGVDPSAAGGKVVWAELRLPTGHGGPVARSDREQAADQRPRRDRPPTTRPRPADTRDRPSALSARLRPQPRSAPRRPYAKARSWRRGR